MADDLFFSSALSDGSLDSWDFIDDAEERVYPPDTFDDYFYNDGGPWLSEDFLIELQFERDAKDTFPPPLKDWKEIHPANFPPQIPVGKARRMTWQKAEEDIRERNF